MAYVGKLCILVSPELVGKDAKSAAKKVLKRLKDKEDYLC